MITLKNLSMNVIQDDAEKVALSNINLQLPSTGLVVLKGDRSSDKTHLLKVLARVEDYTSGSMYVDGVDMGLLTEKEVENYRTHYATAVTSADELMDDLTLKENIYLGMSFGRIKPAKNVMDLLYDNLRLTTSIDKKAKDATPEERIFASIARLMVKSPKIFLIDNFEDIIDPSSMTKMWKVLSAVAEKHLVVIVTDSKPYIEKFANRVIVIEDGKIVSDTSAGKANELKDTKQELMDKSILVKKHRFDTSSMWVVFKQIFSKNVKKVISMMLVSMALVIAFAICASLCVFDTYDSIARASKAHDEAYIQFYKEKNGAVQELNYDNTTGIESIIATLQKENLSYFCAKHDVNWETNINGGYVVPAIVTNSQLLGVGDVNKFGQEIVSGKYTGSAAIANDEEAGTNIVISDYMAEVIIRDGLKGGFAPGQNVEGGLRNIALYDELTNEANYIDVNFRMNDLYYAIVGIYKTDFDKYVDKDLVPYAETKDIFEYNLANVYNVVHVNTNFYTINSRRATSITMPAKNIGVYSLVKDEYNNPIYSSIYTEGEVQIVNGASSYAGELIAGTDLSIINETSRNIYVSADIFYQICVRAGATTTMSDIIANYKSYKSIIANTLFYDIEIEGVTQKCNIAGVIPNAELSKTIIVSGKDVTSENMGVRSKFEYLFIDNNITTNAVMMPAGVFNAGEIESTIDKMASLGFNVSTLASDSIRDFGSTMSNLQILLIAIAVAIVAVIILNIVVSTKKIVSNNNKVIGILRSLGCTKVNVNFIFSTFIILGILASILFATLFSWLITLIINAVMAGSYGYVLSVFTINYLILGIFALLLLLSIVFIVPSMCEKYNSLSPSNVLAIVDKKALRKEAVADDGKVSEAKLEDKEKVKKEKIKKNKDKE
ncbi:MAG: ATP-binding cassette domain-containing protein [Clostridiales bacterium]|nr:ATP-binding cassette domain-containing protein [Clostridiales bacterium]